MILIHGFSISQVDEFNKSSCFGTHKVHYRSGEMWDFTAGVSSTSSSSAGQPIDLTLVMPHYRARNQPIEHKMSALLEAVDAPIKAKIVCCFLWFPFTLFF
jgi:hypothetical protein